MTNDISDEVVARITAYLSGGGLFNPELAIHDAVRDLLIDARAAVLAERKRMIEECAKVVEKKAALLDDKQCCGVGIYTGYGSPECCGDPLYMISNRDAAAAIRALGEK